MPRKYFDPLTGQEQSQVPAAGDDPMASAVSIPRLPGNPVGGVNTSGGRWPNVTPAAQPKQPPAPQLGWADSIQIAPAEAFDVGKKAAGFVKNQLTDPEALAQTAAGVATAGRSTPIGMLASGTAGAIARTGTTIYNEGRAPSPSELGESFLTGAAGDLVGRVAAVPFRGNVRPQVSARGNELAQFMDERGVGYGAHQMTDHSPVLGFMGNVAKYGPSGEVHMEKLELDQANAIMDMLRERGDAMMPEGKTLSLHGESGAFNRGKAGGRYQKDVAAQLKDLRAGSGYEEFLQKHGNARAPMNKVHTLEDGTEIDFSKFSEDELKAMGFPTEKVPTVKELQKRRSGALERGREAYRKGDDKMHASAMADAEGATKQLYEALPDDQARAEYKALADNYNREINRLDNDAVYNLRQETKSDDVIDTLLDGRVKNFSERGSYTGQSNKELLNHIKRSASPDAWQALQGDTIQRVAERAIDPETHMIDYRLLRKQLNSMEPNTKRVLFGSGEQDVNKALALLEQAQKYTDSDAGRLFIAVRTGGAATGAVQHAVTGNLVTRGMASAAMILGMPGMFAKVLTNPTTRSLLVRAFAKGTPSKARVAAVNALSKWAAQAGVEGLREMRHESAAPEIEEPPSGGPF